MEGQVPPFDFQQAISIRKSTGVKAGNLRELRDFIAVTSERSIFHHTYEYFLKGHVLEYTNDFAQWAGQSLEATTLAEHLSNIDPYSFRSISEVREELLRVIDQYLRNFPEPREAVPGDEFFFNESVALVFLEGVRARNLAEFLMALKYVDPGCIYFHFYEARSRMSSEIDDFSRWFEEGLGKKELAQRVRAIDPFMHTMEGIRQIIVALVEQELKYDMEESIA
ncbi:MAG: hypothetical protein A4E57_02181 [Syntrophorhabdaceae bacterium PtaU1.Bin034]|nr:MAG: hypothetical protein A4E57_02181 [Syntrophorhabdaceae bacterium PtaU1.Bin034]